MKLLVSILIIPIFFLLPDLATAQKIIIARDVTKESKCQVQVVRGAQYAGIDTLTAFLEQNLTFPDAALRSKSQGFLVAFLHISPTGLLDSVQVTSSPHSAITAQAKTVLKRLRYWKPARVNGQFVSARAKVFLYYNLLPENYQEPNLANDNFSFGPTHDSTVIQARYNGTDAELYRELSQVAKWPDFLTKGGSYNGNCTVAISEKGKAIKSNPNKYESATERKAKEMLEQVKNWVPATKKGKPVEGWVNFNLTFIGHVPEITTGPTLHATVQQKEIPRPVWFPDFK